MRFGRGRGFNDVGSVSEQLNRTGVKWWRGRDRAGGDKRQEGAGPNV